MIICAFSGGLDSTAMVYKYLKESTPIHVHRVNFITQESSTRHIAETNACRSIVAELRKTWEFPYTESTLDISQNLPQQPDIVKCVVEIAITFMLSNMTVISPSPYTGLARGLGAHDTAQTFHAVRRKQAEDVWNVLTYGKVPLLYPIADYDRIQLWDMLPDNIRRLTISCRKPYINNNEWVQCGRCDSGCKGLIKYNVPLERKLEYTEWN